MGGHGTPATGTRLRLSVGGALAILVAALLAGCGGGASSDADEVAGKYPVKVVSAAFPTRQQVGQTSLMTLGIRNSGRKALPALAISVSIAGKLGRTSTLPFTIHDPQPGLAQPDRPVWVLAARYPRFAGSSKPAGAETSNQKTFDFGPLAPRATANLVWKLSAVKTGRYVLLYSVDAGLGGQSQATTGGGAQPGGSFAVTIGSKPYGTEVTESGEVVPLNGKAKAHRGNR